MGSRLRQDSHPWSAVNTLPDLSGLSWIEAGLFLAVHDAKFPKGADRPRVSLVRLPGGPTAGSEWKKLEIAWPSRLGPSSDLESVSRIPGTTSFLLVESGEGHDEGRQYRRIFLVEYAAEQLRLVSFIDFPVPVSNIEGTAVARVGDHLVFIFAERAEGQTYSELRWARLQLSPLRLGEVNRLQLRGAEPARVGRRVVTALEVDKVGRLYAASAYDSGDDNGPFSSVVSEVGVVRVSPNGKVRVVLQGRPKRLAVLDGFKVESIAIREAEGKGAEVFVGTDDENYGGVIRRVNVNISH